MKPAMSVFQLGRMRHLDLLAIWHQLHPVGQENDGLLAAAMSKELLVTAITETTG